jgi:uncharacterized cupin superfamily protein
MEHVNVFSAVTELDPDDPPGYRAPRAKRGPLIGASMLGGSICELQTGQSVCPHHYEYGNEEWLLVLEGAATLRHPDGEGDRETVLAPGDLVCFPQGPQGAHKIGIWPDDGRDSLTVRRESAVDYYDGEL